jgi:hypothetical protein
MPDFMGSLLVFSIVITIFLFSWNSVESNQQKFDVEEQIRQDSYYTTTFLVSTPGYPEDWNNSTVKIPGFASEADNIISPQKLREFRNISYDRQKKLLNSRNFHLIFRNDTHVLELDSEKLKYGQKPVNASTVVPSARNVLIDKPGGLEDAEMRYIVWR